MGLVIKAALGALVVLLIGVLAKTKNYYIAGLIPLFPTFALIAHYIVASERGIEALRATIIFSMWSIIPYFVYLAGNDSNLLIVFYVQIMPDDLVMQLHRF